MKKAKQYDIAIVPDTAQWIPGYEEAYKVTPDAIVYSYKDKRGPRELTQFTQMYDYNVINLLSGSNRGDLNTRKRTTCLVHQLVMHTFGPKRPYPPKDYVITHIDKDKKNNNIDNLKWIKRSNVKTKPPSAIKATGIDDGDIIMFRNITIASKYFHTNQTIIRSKVASKEVYKGYLLENLA